MTIRHIGYEPNAADLVRQHFLSTGETLERAYDEDYAAGTYTFHLLCHVCKQIKSVTVPGSGLYRYNQGAHIQAAFPELAAADRELLLNNTCGECFDKLFPEEDDGDD